MSVNSRSNHTPIAALSVLVLVLTLWAAMIWAWFTALFYNLENHELIVTLIALIPPIGMIEGILIWLGLIG